MANNPYLKNLPPEYIVDYDHIKMEFRVRLFEYYMAIPINSDDPAEIEYAIRKARESIDQMIVADYHAGKLALKGGGASATSALTLQDKYAEASRIMMQADHSFKAPHNYPIDDDADAARYLQDSPYKEKPESFIRPGWLPDEYLKGSWGAPTKKKIPAPKKKNAIEELITTTNPDAITFDF